MFLYLLDFLSSYNSNFLVFEYITLRAILSIITALLISLLLGPYIINKFSANNLSEVIRDDGPSSHFSKSGTPTMGGVIIIIGILTSTLLWADLSNIYIWTLIFVSLSLGGLGFVDDLLKIKGISDSFVYVKKKPFVYKIYVVSKLKYINLVNEIKNSLDGYKFSENIVKLVKIERNTRGKIITKD